MTTRTIALIGLLCLGTAGTTYTPPAEARTFVDVDVNVAPPAPRYERVAVRRGYTWAPGYWNWRGGRHVWVGGNYVRERPGYIWVPHRWVRGARGWHMAPGHWAPRGGMGPGVGIGPVVGGGPGIGFINVAPPTPVYERVVARPGYVWTPGYHRWDAGGRRYVWVGGRYDRERAGYVWVAHRWVQGPQGWHMEEGHWARR